jgi:hypothetical protein
LGLLERYFNRKIKKQEKQQQQQQQLSFLLGVTENRITQKTYF